MAHVAKILYHWRMHPNSTAANPQSKSYCHVAGQKAIQDHLDRVGVKGEVIMSEVFCTYRVKYERESSPLVSIVIPNKDHISDLKLCIDSVQEKSSYRNIEFIVVENNSTEKKHLSIMILFRNSMIMSELLNGRKNLITLQLTILV